jgi:hypothetical protein
MATTQTTAEVFLGWAKDEHGYWRALVLAQRPKTCHRELLAYLKRAGWTPSATAVLPAGRRP